jgi:Tol biopolymer transport system component
VVTSLETGVETTILTPADLADECPSGARCGFHPLLSWAPDGRQLAFVYGDMASPTQIGAAVFVAGADGSNAVKIGDCVDGGGRVERCSELAWSPDGARVAWVAGSGLRVADLATGEARQLVGPGCAGCADPGAPARDISWSPDGNEIAYRADAPGSQIRAVAADGSSWRILIDPPRRRFVGRPAWSPDGSRLLFRLDVDLVVQDLRTGTRSVIAEGTGWAGPDGGVWSPDGDAVAWREVSAASEAMIWTANPDGSVARPVFATCCLNPNRGDVFGGPSYAPDGTSLLFRISTSNPAMSPTTFVTDADTGEVLASPRGWAAAWEPSSDGPLGVAPLAARPAGSAWAWILIALAGVTLGLRVLIVRTRDHRAMQATIRLVTPEEGP